MAWLTAPGVGLVAGPVRATNHRERIPSFFAHQTDHSTEDFLYATANVFYRREAIERLGGFNERYGAYPWGTPVGGEDADLAWRVKRAGYRSVFVTNNPVYHEATDMPVAAWLIEPIRAQIMPRLVKQFPELREGLWHRYFLSRGNALFYLVLAGVCAASVRRSVAPLILAVPWLWDLRSMIKRDIGRPRRWWRIPVKYGLTAERYLVETIAVVFSSIRHRTPVL